MSPERSEVAPPAGPETRSGEGAGLAGLARGGAASLAGSAVSAIAGVLVVLVVTRALSQDAAGLFFTLTSVYLIAETSARLGTSSGVVWAISRAWALGEARRVSVVLRAALTPVVLLSVVLAGVLMTSAEALTELLTGGPDHAVETAVRVLACLLPLTVVSETLLSATRGYGTILPTVSIDRLGRSLLQLAAVAVAATTASLAGLVAAWAAPWVLSSLFAGWWLVRLHRRTALAPAVRPATHDEPVPWRSFWAFTAPRALTSLVQLALQRLDIVLLTVLAGPAEAAVYTAATRFLVVGQFANQALANVVEPRIGHLLALDDRPATRTVYQTATGWLVLLTWPFYLLVASGAEGLLDLFGSGYDAGVPVVLVLTATMLVASAVGMVDVVLIMAGRTRWNLGNALAALALNVVLDVILIPVLGLLGAALGWAAAILLKNLLPLVQIWRSMGLHPFGVGTRTAMVLALVCFALPPVAAEWVLGGGPLATIGLSVVGAVLYVVLCRNRRTALGLESLRSIRHGRPGVR
jgi:O-antigen/teichoic acid export membrane protein